MKKTLFGILSIKNLTKINLTLVSINWFHCLHARLCLVGDLLLLQLGHKIYVFGGCINGDMTSNVFVIDCLHGTFQFLPSMRVPRGCAAFGIVDGKIYVIGGYNKADSLDNWVEVFDLEKQTWESFSGLCNEELSKITLKSVVMNKKIYIMDRGNGIVFDPKKGVWERDFLLDRDWVVGSCVIDNMLYTFGFDSVKRIYRVRVYDPSVRVWSFVKGIEDIPKMDGTLGSRMANHGGKLVILLNLDKNGGTELWCIKIALERRGQQGEIWGKILWYNLVLTLENSSTIVECFDITI
ncbi:Galactose oxidase/kelch repeat superfamily protein [Arabidopsis thaliana]|uniref:Galactose oxidase/kelch repeat superfamily protein n=1 Tax=Arabidopsis thaliana TaxID=3702 RepID=UPI000016358B|nr:Galactose oxidase/kelch repeat superfamily protein [Arabidopsis thaliana]AEE77379.1 Galactose oxidase/kelch repeat superfamily protein [Arabidopsis thaliana]|eukprot:NP_189429.1 Galactose oxidase/kelch repeat superfamily protein [Arabidopsis thaliana]